VRLIWREVCFEKKNRKSLVVGYKIFPVTKDEKKNFEILAGANLMRRWFKRIILRRMLFSSHLKNKLLKKNSKILKIRIVLLQIQFKGFGDNS